MTERSKATKSNRVGEGPLLARIFGMVQEPRVVLMGIATAAGVGGRRGRKRRRAEERRDPSGWTSIMADHHKYMREHWPLQVAEWPQARMSDPDPLEAIRRQSEEEAAGFWMNPT